MGSSSEAAKYWQEYTTSLESDAKTHAANHPAAAEHFHNAAKHASTAGKHFGTQVADDDAIKSLNIAERHYMRGLKAADIKEDMEESHPVEFYDAREKKSKAKWHYDRAGKQKGASLSKGIKNDYEAELLRRGVKDSNGKQLPLRKEEEELQERNQANKVKKDDAIKAVGRKGFLVGTKSPTTLKRLGRAKLKEDGLDEGHIKLPLKGHAYHAKSDAELHYIIRDASEAARAMQGHSPGAEGKYLDQANDASTILGHRRRTGQGPIKAYAKKGTDEEVDEALVAKATLDRYRAKAKSDFRAKGGINAALDKQDSDDDKARWAKMAALRKQGPEAVQAWRKTQGMTKEDIENIDEIGFANKFAPLKKSAPNSGYMNVGGGKKGFNSSNPDMRINRRAGLDKDIGWDDDAPKAQAKQAEKMDKFKKKAAMRKEDDMPHIIDVIMVEDEMSADLYIEQIESRCNEIVAEQKAEMRKTLFALKKDTQ